jgi:hypothetical protein
VHKIFVAKRKQTITNCYTRYTYTIRRTGTFDQEICVKACKRRWLCVETFNIISKWRFSSNVVTKTDSMELNKRHRHLNCIMAIPTMLCYIPWIISLCTCHVYFTLRNGVVYFKMKLWLYQSSSLTIFITCPLGKWWAKFGGPSIILLAQTHNCKNDLNFNI